MPDKEIDRSLRVADLESRVSHLEFELTRIEGKLDQLWREYTLLINRLK